MIWFIFGFWIGTLFGAASFDQYVQKNGWYKEDLDEYLEKRNRHIIERNRNKKSNKEITK